MVNGSTLHLFKGPYIFAGRRREDDVNFPMNRTTESKLIVFGYFSQKVDVDIDIPPLIQHCVLNYFAKQDVGLVFLGLYGISNPIKHDAVQSIERAKNYGQKMIFIPEKDGIDIVGKAANKLGFQDKDIAVTTMTNFSNVDDKFIDGLLDKDCIIIYDISHGDRIDIINKLQARESVVLVLLVMVFVMIRFVQMQQLVLQYMMQQK